MLNQQPPLGAETLFEGAACGLLITSEDGLILRANTTFCSWLGYAKHELAGRRFQDLLTMGGRIFHQTHWNPLMSMQGSVREVKLELLNHQRLPVAVLINGARREQGGVFYHQLAIFGTTDRDRYEREILRARKAAEEALQEKTQAEAALLEAQQELNRAYTATHERAVFAEQMVAIASHDLKAPLTAIGVGSELLAQGTLSEAEAHIAEHIRTSANQAVRMVADLLDFTQVKLGSGIRICPQPADLHALVDKSIEASRVAFPQAALTHHRIGSGLALLDNDRLQQVASNLIANSIAYGDSSRPVTVTSAYEEGRASVCVHNFGSAIPEALQGRLFEPMVRGDANGHGRSVGLGLFIVREIAQAHGGAVAVVSSEDEGTAFRVSFPMPAV